MRKQFVRSNVKRKIPLTRTCQMSAVKQYNSFIYIIPIYTNIRNHTDFLIFDIPAKLVLKTAKKNKNVQLANELSIF